MKSWHDYHINGYSVDLKNREINFSLVKPRAANSPKASDLVFGGVHGYELSNDSMASIVFGFNEISLNEFLSKFGGAIKEAYRNNGAYGPWASDLSAAEQLLTNSGVRAFTLTSSLGMVGWVLATHVTSRESSN